MLKIIKRLKNQKIMKFVKIHEKIDKISEDWYFDEKHAKIAKN